MNGNELKAYLANGAMLYIPLMQHGFDDYLAARWLFVNLRPERAASLFHRAIELFLKASLVLVDRSYDEKALRAFGKSGHDLSKVWRALKSKLKVEDDRFDERIRELQKWESVRYPRIAQRHVVLFRHGERLTADQMMPTLPPTETLTLSLDEMDQLVVGIFALLRPLNPRCFFVAYNDEVFRLYRRHNNHLLFNDVQKPISASMFAE